MKIDVDKALADHGIQPSAQRVAVAQYVLLARDHPTADRVWSEVRARFPWISRATVYNTLNLFVERGLLRSLAITEGSVVFDPKTDKHHHLIDDGTGQIHDVPWDAVEVHKLDSIEGFDITDYQVVMRGARRGARKRGRPTTVKRRTR